MEKLSISDARNPEVIGTRAVIQGWVRTRRDSKGGFSLLEVNDGTSLANLQIIADNTLENYEQEINRLSAGCSVSIEGEVKEKTQTKL